MSTCGQPHEEAKVPAEARYDGKWVLRTNTDLTAEQKAVKHKQLWQVRIIFSHGGSTKPEIKCLQSAVRYTTAPTTESSISIKKLGCRGNQLFITFFINKSVMLADRNEFQDEIYYCLSYSPFHAESV
jgi:hypothetical protein